MYRFSRTELALFLIPLLVVPAAILTQKWKTATTPKPIVVPTPTPIPPTNLYTDPDLRVGSIMPSPDGRFIHTGVYGNRTRFSTWDAKSGALIRRFGVFRFDNADAVFSTDGKVIAFPYGGWEGDRVVLMNSATGKVQLQLKDLKSMGWGIDVNDEVVAMPARDDVRLFNNKTGKYVLKLRHRARDFFPHRLRFSPDGKTLLWIGFSGYKSDSYANGNSNDEIVWFDWKKRKRLHALEFPQTELFQACFSGDGKVILATGYRSYWVKSRAKKSAIATDTRFFAVDARTGKQIYTWPINDRYSQMTISPDGKWFAILGRLGTYSAARQELSIYEVSSGRLKHRVLSKEFPDNCAWSADSRTLYMKDDVMLRFVLQKDGTWQMQKGKPNSS